MAHVHLCSLGHAKGVATEVGLTSPALEIEGGSVMRRIKLVVVVMALLVMLMAVGAAPAIADRSDNNNNGSRVTVNQSCSSGDISIGDNNDDNDTSIVVNSRGGCKHGKKHHGKRHHRR
jgi:hypothetical protein